MFKWKRKHEGDRFEYTLVLEDDEDEVVGSVVVIEDIGNGDITVKAECEEIGYKATEERVDQKFGEWHLVIGRHWLGMRMENLVMVGLRLKVSRLIYIKIGYMDEKAWKEGSMFNKPTIMEISEGQIEYHRFKIIVSRGRNNELFVVAEYVSKDQKETKQLIGIGAYGYDDDGNYVGVTEETKGEFFNWIKTSKEDWWFPMLIDVTKIKDFKTFNQGDKYIADKFGLETPVNTDEPILGKALKNIDLDK